MKGISLISGVIFLALTISATVIIYSAAYPLVIQMQDQASFEKMTTTLSELDGVIRAVAAGGPGTKRTVFIDPQPGVLTINDTKETIEWEMETSALFISPRTAQRFGNLIIGSNLETSLLEGNYTHTSPEIPCYIMENSHLKVYVRRIGSESSPVAAATSNILIAIYNKDLNSWLNNPGFMEFSIDNSYGKTGQIYTKPETTGYNLPYGSVKVVVDSTYIDYNLSLELPSGADFIEIRGEYG
jgi:hypothetical protein